MNTENKEKSTKSETAENPGLIKRIIKNLDTAMKKKADAQSEGSSCCSGDDKGGKCC